MTKEGCKKRSIKKTVCAKLNGRKVCAKAGRKVGIERTDDDGKRTDDDGKLYMRNRKEGSSTGTHILVPYKNMVRNEGISYGSFTCP